MTIECPYCDTEQGALKNHVRLTDGNGHGPVGSYPDDFEQDSFSTDNQSHGFGCVYAVKAPDGSVKIGKSMKPITRFRQIQSLNHKELELALAVSYPTYEHVETELHRKYDPYRKHGEWFELDENLLDSLLEDMRSKWSFEVQP